MAADTASDSVRVASEVSLRVDLLLGDTDVRVGLDREMAVQSPCITEQLQFPFAIPQTHAERIVNAYRHVSTGLSVDSLLADPVYTHRFHQQCWAIGAPGTPQELNSLLLRLRKRGRVRRDVSGKVRRCEIPDHVSIASHLAMAVLNEDRGENDQFTCDDLLIDQDLQDLFQAVARSIVPGYSFAQYIHAVLRFRKSGRKTPKPQPESSLWGAEEFGFNRIGRLEDFKASDLPRTKGIYLLRSEVESVYLGCATNIRTVWDRIDRLGALDALYRIVDPISLDSLALEIWPTPQIGLYQLEHFHRYQIGVLRPRFNPGVGQVA